MQRRASQDYLPVNCAESSSISAFWLYIWLILRYLFLISNSSLVFLKNLNKNTLTQKKKISLVRQVVYIDLLWVPFLGCIGMYGRCVHDVSGCGKCACCIFPGKSHNRLRHDDLSTSPAYDMGKTPISESKPEKNTCYWATLKIVCGTRFSGPSFVPEHLHASITEHKLSSACPQHQLVWSSLLDH